MHVLPATVDSAAFQPSTPEFLGATRPAFALARNRIDTVGAVVAGGNVLVGRFERLWRFTVDSLRGARVIARWADGDPAAIERDSGRTCRKSVLIPLDSAGDMILRPAFVKFHESLSEPCQHASSAPDAALATLVTGSDGKLASATDFPVATDVTSPIARWLIVLAILLAILEMVLRRAQSSDGGER